MSMEPSHNSGGEATETIIGEVEQFLKEAATPSALSEAQILVADRSVEILAELQQHGSERSLTPGTTIHHEIDSLEQDLEGMLFRKRRMKIQALKGGENEAVAANTELQEIVQSETPLKACLSAYTIVRQIAEGELSSDSAYIEDALARVYADKHLSPEERTALQTYGLEAAAKLGVDISEERIAEQAAYYEEDSDRDDQEYTVLTHLTFIAEGMQDKIMEHPQWDLFVDAVIRRDQLQSRGASRIAAGVYENSIRAYAEELGIAPFILTTVMDTIDGKKSGF